MTGHRLGKWLLNFLIAFDQMCYVWLAGWAYVWFDYGSCPNPDETISAFVGCNAELGKPWALVAEKIINTLFWFMPNHCRSAINGDYRRAAEEQLSLRS